MECMLGLRTKLVSDLKITLKETVENNIWANSEICGVVYSDMEYEASLFFDKEIRDIKIYINDTLRECFYDNGRVIFKATDFLDKRIFLNYFGYVSFTISIKTDEANYEFYSSYLDVAIRDNISSELIREMVAYISQNSQKYLFKEESNIKDFADVKRSKTRNINTEISMLENILFEYENNYKYFKTSAKSKIDNCYIVDDFDKLKEVRNETIQYIISNPQNLITVNHNTGILYNKLNLQPKKTLINKNKLSHNIYENQIVLSFLKYIYNSILTKIKEVEKKNNNSQKYSIRPEYTSSSNEIYKEISIILNKYTAKLYSIKEKVQQFYFMYKQVLRCDEVNLNRVPKPTAIFLETQHYRRIYKVIKDWFESGNYELESEKMILTFSEASQIYEYYVLFKINNFIIKRGYQLTNSKKFFYQLRRSAKYENTKYENTFLFENSTTRITVYYQPVIYLDQAVNDIGLFRNNDISFDVGKAQYYTPDYVIKMEGLDSSEFIILDAKWATIESVINYSLRNIIYKYAFSISTLNKSDMIRSIWVINGKELQNQEDYVYNLYNSKFKDRNNELTPSVKVVTLNPKIDRLVQGKMLNQVISLE